MEEDLRSVAQRTKAQLLDPAQRSVATRPAAAPVAGLAGRMLHLQRVAGNRAVAGLVAQRDDNISAPTNVRVRSGPGGSAKVSGAGGLGQAFGLGRGLVEGPGTTRTPELESGRPVLDEAARPRRAAPQRPPSADQIELEGAACRATDPVKAITVHAAESGKLLKETQRHDTKIERYSRFFEADLEHLGAKKEEWAVAVREESALKKVLDGKRSKKVSKIEKEVGGQPDIEWTATRQRVELVTRARATADKEVPLVDGVYEEARQEAAAAKADPDTGGRSYAHARGRVAAMADTALRNGVTDAAQVPGIAKHEQRMKAIGRWKDRERRLARLVQQAKLSHGVLLVLRSQLKAGKAQIKAKDRGVGLLGHLGKKAGTSLAGLALSTATLGVMGLSQEKADGGYTSKREVQSIRSRLKVEFARIGELLDKKPYGPVNTLHASLDMLSVVLREVRNVIGSVALLAALLSIVPGLGAVFAPVAGFCTLLALGITSFKLALDTVLTGWSVITRALNDNARNEDLLTSQSVRQGTEAAGGALAVTGALSAPIAGNALNPGHYYNPLERDGAAGYAGYAPEAVGPSVMSDPGGAAMAGLNKLQSRAPGLGVTLGATAAHKAIGAVTDFEAVSTGHFHQGARARHAASAPTARRGAGAGPPLPMRPPQRLGNEPAWIVQARKDERDAREASLRPLLNVHASHLRRLHGKTQALVADTGSGPAKADALAKGLAKAGKGDAAEHAGIVGQTSDRFGATMAATSGLLAECAEPQVLAATRPDGPEIVGDGTG